ncbi:MAG: translation initiation factor [Saprospiraceae bacterium]|nr:translation initiation factor [Saprospiraceae bacterium]
MADLFAGVNISGDDAVKDAIDESNIIDQPESNISSDDRVRVWLDRKSRGGKEATIIEGITCNADDLKQLATFIKTSCGVGGSAKEGQIIIQGNRRDKVVELLKQKGFKNVKKAGG